MAHSQHAGPGLDEAFPVRPFIFYRHPTLGSTVFWQENCLEYLSEDGQPVRIWLARVPTGTWVTLVDDSGRPLPVSVYRNDEPSLLAKWLPD